MPTNTNDQQPRQHGFRTHIRVVRSDGREWPNMFVAYRELLGTTQELGYSEHQRMRAAIRAGMQPRDSHGFSWRSAQPITATGGMQISWTDFTFGVEIECLAPFSQYDMREKLNRAGFSNWRVVNDGSLTRAPGYEPMEIVSPVLRGEDGLQKLRALLDLMNGTFGCKVNRSCGMHVHVGVRGMPIQRVRKIALAFLAAEQHFDALVAPDRRSGNRYCQSNRALVRNSGELTLANATSISGIGNVMNGGNSPAHYNPYRYYKLNFQSFVHHGTIEFRQHSGTVESEKAAAWVRLVTGFCAVAGGDEGQARFENLEAFLQRCSGDAIDYLRRRAARFAAATARAAA